MRNNQAFLREFLLTCSRDLRVAKVVKDLVVAKSIARSLVMLRKNAEHRSRAAAQRYRSAHIRLSYLRPYRYATTAPPGGRLQAAQRWRNYTLVYSREIRVDYLEMCRF